MAWANERKKFNKVPFEYVEFTVNSETYRFCSDNISKMPAGFSGTPKLKSFSMSPAQIDLAGGIGIRATANASILEFLDYKVYGTITSPVRFWAAWRAHNRNYRYTAISHYSGYLVDNTVDSENFIRRDYVIETMTYTAQGVNMSLRDPLMLANDSKAVCPRVSSGSLTADLLVGVTSFTLQPAGIADDEYPEAATADSSTYYFVRFNDEIMQVTNRVSGSDTFTVVRAQYGTTEEEHSQDDTCQLCYYNPGSPADFDYDVLVNYAGVDPSYIDKGVWDARSNAAFPNTYDPLITEPTGVRTLLKESCESAPHYLYYDTRFNTIQFKPQESPPTSASRLSSDGNLLKSTSTVSDRYDLFVTNVAVFFDIRNPVKDLEEQSNYRQIYERQDDSAIAANGGIKSYRLIYSRFISGSSKSAAVLAAALIGRRGAVPPIELTYELDPKDGDVWTGDNVEIQSDLVFDDATNAPGYKMYQVVSANENTKTQRYKYVAVEHTYGDPVAGDEDVEDPNTRLLYISGKQDQLKDPDTGVARSLRDYYDATYPTISADFDVKFIIESSAVAGSSVNTLPAIKTGTWPELTTPPIIINTGLIVGKAGDGGDAVGGNGEDGGLALYLDDNIRIDNQGTIAGGGAGGGGAQVSASGETVQAGGGAGAGYTNGLAGTGTYASGAGVITRFPQDGTDTTRGLGGLVSNSSVPISATGGPGAGLGADGAPGVVIGATGLEGSGGLAGAAIEQNGYTITWINTGTVHGAINA